MLRIAFALAGVFYAGVALCAAAPPATTVHLRGQAFAPLNLKVSAGAQITWTNDDTVPHSVTADDKRFDSGAIAPGKSFSWTADKPGAVAYHCIFHPSMTGTIDVEASGTRH